MLMKWLNHPTIASFYAISFNSVEHQKRLKSTILMQYVTIDSLDKILEKEKKGTAPHEWMITKKYICLLGDFEYT